LKLIKIDDNDAYFTALLLHRLTSCAIFGRHIKPENKAVD